MFFYTKTGVNVLSFFITCLCFLCFLFLYGQGKKVYTSYLSPTLQQVIESLTNKPEEKQNVILEQGEQQESKISKEEEQLASYEWGIAIPKIELIAPIKEGTTKEVMNEAVGHFSNTQKEQGNIGLAAHNRGYPVNYFQNVKKLKIGDCIYYKVNGLIVTYIVDCVTIIRDDDWSYLENTEDNRLTLITCVENEPTYRRCIQAIERKNEI